MYALRAFSMWLIDNLFKRKPLLIATKCAYSHVVHERVFPEKLKETLVLPWEVVVKEKDFHG